MEAATSSPQQERRTLRVAEVSRMLNVPRQSIHRWVKAGLLPAVRVGKIVLIEPAELERFLDSHRRSE